MIRLFRASLVTALFAQSAIATPDRTQVTTPIPVEQDAPRPWQPEDGDKIRFDVFRQGDKKFGTHMVRFHVSDDGSYRVISDVNLKAGLGPITLFHYSLSSTETWHDDRLVALEGNTNDDGKKENVSASLSGEKLSINGSGYTGRAPLGIIPSSHWNIQQVFSSEILSTENGELLDTRVTRMGEETLRINGQAVPATHYRLVSDLTVDLWYDEQNRWVQLSFEARGQKIDYRLARLY